MPHGMTWQTGDATAHRTGISHLEMMNADAIDTPHMVDGYQLGDSVVVAGATQPFRGFSQLVAAPTIAQTDEDGRLGALYGKVGHRDILHHTTIDNLQ